MDPFWVRFDVFCPFWGPGALPMRPDRNSVRFPATNASNRAMATQIKSFYPLGGVLELPQTLPKLSQSSPRSSQGPPGTLQAHPEVCSASWVDFRGGGRGHEKCSQVPRLHIKSSLPKFASGSTSMKNALKYRACAQNQGPRNSSASSAEFAEST